MTELVDVAEMQVKEWGKIHKEAVAREKKGEDLSDCYQAAIQLCLANIMELRDSAGNETTRTALLEAGLQPSFVKELLHI